VMPNVEMADRRCPFNVSLCSRSFTLPEFDEDLNQLLYVADVRCRSREAKDV